MEKEDDVVGLLNLIRDLCYGTDKKRYIGWSQQAHLRRTLRFEQQPGESLQEYATNFMEQVRVLEELFGPFVPTRDLVTTVEFTGEVGEGEGVEEEPTLRKC